MASHNAGQDSDQAQMRRNEYLNQPSDIHNQGQATNFFQETSTQAKNMAQNAMNMAKGAAAGAATMAQGAAEAVKNTLGMNSPETTTATSTATTTTTTGTAMNNPGNTTNMGGSTNPSNPNTRM